MSFLILGYAFACSIVGAGIQAVCGFGYGAISMTVMPYLWAYQQAVATSSLCGCSTAVIIAVTNFRYINWKMLIPCAVTGTITAAAAIRFSLGAARGVMMHSLGVLLIAMGFYQLFFNGKITIKPTIRNGIIAGFCSGALSGLFAMSGPPAAIYMIAAAQTNDEYRATLNAQFSITALASAVARFVNGIIGKEVIIAVTVMLPALAIGSVIGSRVFHKLDAKRLRQLVNAYLIVSGIMMLVK